MKIFAEVFYRILFCCFLLGGIASSVHAQGCGKQPIPEAAMMYDSAGTLTPWEKEWFAIEMPEVILEGIETKVKIQYTGPEGKLAPFLNAGDKISVCVNGVAQKIELNKGEGYALAVFSEGKPYSIAVYDAEVEGSADTVSAWLSILPPLLAIVMALLFREVLTSLFLGIFLGGALIHVHLVGIKGIAAGLLAVLDTYILNSIADTDHVSVIVFSMLIGGMVALISRNGGMQGVVNKISKYAKDAKSGQLATWFLGVAIFFDDYANTLVVGNTMRPVTDRLKISREKLSYLVDSTAAPISAIAFVTTWIGAELGYIESGLEGLTGLQGDESPYGIFISSLQYSFYPILTLLFMLMLILRNRDFGPMHAAEVRARTTGQVFAVAPAAELDREKKQELDDLEPLTDTEPRWFNAFIPVAVVIIGTVIGLFYTGWSDDVWNDATISFSRKISFIIGDSNSYAALLWSSMSGVIVGLILTLSQRIMTLEQSIDSLLSGFKSMLTAMMILILAWALAEVTKDLHTADFITSGLESWGLAPWLIPSLTFILAGIVAFSTGSSWGTMAILYPLMIPAAWKVSQESGMDYHASMEIMFNVVSCVLAGSVLGDHCSPISDTTILSSLASSCNHIDHVRTQLPYALTVGAVAVLGGTLPGALGVPFWITFPVCLGLLYGIVQFVGKEVPTK